ncbi:MAG TPA: S49 family peptidase, partial [Acidobacteriota bacterium]|nr:S49 family peptidase [Acidobacteriota bacterium]
GKFDLSGFYDWLGIDIQQVKGASNAGFFSLAKPLTPAQARRVEEWMSDVYEGFVGKAAEARGMDYDQMEIRARGRIYTGRQAFEHGLVDALGGVDEALTLMKEELGLTPEDQISLELFPKPKTMLEALLESGFFGLSGPPVEEIRDLLQELQTPRAWLIAPTVTVR